VEVDTNVIRVGVAWTDAAGNAPEAVSDSPNYEVDTKEPTLTSAIFTDAALKVGETSVVTFIFSETVTGFAIGVDVTVADGTGALSAQAGSGTTYTATFTPTDDYESATNVLTIAMTGVIDAAGNAGLSTAESSNYAIDTKEPVVVITSPYGGEIWLGGATEDITWTPATDNDIALTGTPITIEYSINNSTSWTEIATGQANDGTYAWETVPNLSSVNCLVRITAVDLAGNSASSNSNSVFTITADTEAPSVTVNSPNGDESWLGASTHIITWTATDDRTLSGDLVINLKYSTDAGGSWTTIASSETNDDAYSWTVPSITNSNCLVKVEAVDTAGKTGLDVSNGVFTITTSTEVTTIDMESDWNLISLMRIPTSSAIATVLSGVTENVAVAWSYDASSTTWSSYIPDAADDLVTMVDGKGYWVSMTSSDTLTVSGQEMPDPPAVPRTYDVVVGWNLIGFKSTTAAIASDYLEAISGKYTLIYSYNAATQVYATVLASDNLEPGKGYWLAVTEAGTIYP